MSAVAALAAVTLLGACSDAPAPAPAPASTPTSASTPTPTPTSLADADVEPDRGGDDEAQVGASDPVLDEAAAIEAAVAWRSDRVECVDGGPVDELHEVVLRRDDVLVVHAVCFLGAYQPTGQLLVYDGELGTWPVEQWVDGAVVELADVIGDVRPGPDGVLVNLQLARALGDCGVLQEWVVEGERFVLRSAREQPCGEEAAPALPEDWPLVHER